MVFVFHKFKHYLLANKFVFYFDHMALVYMVNIGSKRVAFVLEIQFYYSL
jgi:hypothetical protein